MTVCAVIGQVASDEVSRRLQITQGACLQQVLPNGAAAKAGLLPTRRGLSGIITGDVVVALAGRPVQTGADLARELDQYQVGTRLGPFVSFAEVNEAPYHGYHIYSPMHPCMHGSIIWVIME